tara:strand:- start:11375 stop:12622 length:1248 start_codon:yes stop_codon:yes gene_type:complete
MISSKSIIINRQSFIYSNKIDIDIDIKTSDDYPIDYINKNYKNMLNKIKNEVCNFKNWYIYRKLFTNSLFLNYYHNKKNIGIFKKNVLSRSFFKMIEIQNDYNILKMSNKKVKIAFIAEAPGGFIEACYKIRNKNIEDKYYTISLIDNKISNIPTWYNLKKKMIHKKNIEICSGYDNTGDIYKLINIFNYIKNVGKHTCDIVTADGGFDFTTDFINQEYNFARLFLCEIIIGLNLQKIGGNFVVKCFDLTNILNLKIFYILCHLYEKVIITKLKTSRKTNSERYIVCKNMQEYIDDNILQKLYEVILKWDTYTEQNKKIIDIFSFEIDKFFIKKIELYNSWFFEKQLDIYRYIININNNLSNILINDIIKQIIIDNIDSCISFCRLNNIFIDFNSYFIETNINEIINTHFLLQVS